MSPEPDQRQIYASEAARYERLVAAEDWRGRLLPAIADVVPLAGALVVEAGAGTGRLTRLLSPCVRQVHAFDRSGHMLRHARGLLQRECRGNWSLAIADNQDLPLGNRCADIAIAGWNYGHSTVWNNRGWRVEVDRALGEMLRVLRPGGTAIILETLGTGSKMPRPPTENLAAYYRWLETERGFARRWLRTDYRFGSRQEARELLGFFFGEEFASQAPLSASCVLPECTGLWWRRASDKPLR
ncbi:MAG: methyltransferase domain-containing protein [Anaerolineaceae bacterium]|nr:methyltransferase domain-containing protein [Anaerolineaceae bacterium]